MKFLLRQSSWAFSLGWVIAGGGGGGLGSFPGSLAFASGLTGSWIPAIQGHAVGNRVVDLRDPG